MKFTKAADSNLNEVQEGNKALTTKEFVHVLPLFLSNIELCLVFFMKVFFLFASLFFFSCKTPSQIFF